jgi:hypothetical protein
MRFGWLMASSTNMESARREAQIEPWHTSRIARANSLGGVPPKRAHSRDVFNIAQTDL